MWKIGSAIILPPTLTFGRAPPPDRINASFGPANWMMGAIVYLLTQPTLLHLRSAALPRESIPQPAQRGEQSTSCLGGRVPMPCWIPSGARQNRRQPPGPTRFGHRDGATEHRYGTATTTPPAVVRRGPSQRAFLARRQVPRDGPALRYPARTSRTGLSPDVTLQATAADGAPEGGGVSCRRCATTGIPLESRRRGHHLPRRASWHPKILKPPSVACSIGRRSASCR